MCGLRATDSLLKKLYIKNKGPDEHRTFEYIVKKITAFTLQALPLSGRV